MFVSAVFTIIFLIHPSNEPVPLKDSISARWLLLSAAACVLIGIVLATFYVLRFQIPMEWVSIPNMKIWHGTLNTLGFAWLSLLGYARIQTKLSV